MTGNILGIVGIVFTISFGIYSIWVYKKSKRGVSLEFTNEQCYSLFRDDVTRLNIEIMYNKKSLTNALILLKAKLINNGQIDIDRNRIFKPLKIISPKGFEWLEARLTSQPTDSTANIILLNKNEIQIDWDLIKTGEYVEFETLVEITDNEESDIEKTYTFYDGITFDYRITDLNNIQKEKKVAKTNIESFIYNYSKILAIFIILLGGLLFTGEYYTRLKFLPEKKEIFFIIGNELSQNSAFLETKGYNSITFQTSDSTEKKTLKIEEFNKKYKIEKIDKINVSPDSSLLNKVTGIAYIILGLLIYILKTRTEKKRKLIKK